MKAGITLFKEESYKKKEGWVEFVLNNPWKRRETLAVIRLREILASRLVSRSMRES